MRTLSRAMTLAMACGLLLAGCAAPTSREGGGTSSAPASSAPKRIVAAIPSSPGVISNSVLAATGVTPQGVEAVETMVMNGMTIVDHQGVPRARLAEDVPTTENGLWKLLPDGKMEVTWRIRRNAEWHDGTPFTADDILFTQRLTQDRELAAFRHKASTHDPIENIEAPDPWTVTARWSKPYIYANLAFGYDSARPLYPVPKHVFERPYLESKATFYELPHWSSEYVGVGPFKVKEFVEGSHLVLTANDRYMLGRPKLDEIEIRFITDPAAMVASFLAEAVNVNLGVSLSMEQARDVLARLPGAKMDVAPTGVLTAYPQFINPDPPIIGNLAFRRALLHAVDRQEMVDTLMFGQSSIGHAFIHPGEADYKDIEASIVKYDYDARRAAQLFEQAGLTRGADGTYRDASGQTPTLEIRTDRAGGDLRSKSALALADYWKRAGVGATATIIPPQRDGDQEYLATYPGFEITRRGNFRWSLDRVLTSKEASLPENRYSGGNRGRYQNPELDEQVVRHDLSLDYRDRTRALAEIVRITSENVVLMGLMYDLDPTVYSQGIQQIFGKYERSTQAWNVNEWDRA
jgi:peptide/nickel transport system substrate-binding protein